MANNPIWGIILIKDDVMDVAHSIELAGATMKKMRRNLFWALIYDSAGIPIAAIGLLSSIIAAAAMALSLIPVIANSSLLKRLKIVEKEETHPAETMTSLKETEVEV